MKNLNERFINASRSGFNVGKVSSGIQTLSMIPVGIVVGAAPVMRVNHNSSADFIHRGGQIPAPVHSFKN